MRSFRALLAFVFAVLMGGAGAQDTLLLCRMEQALHVKCCCRGAELARDAADDEVRRAPCCIESALATTPVPPSSALALAAVAAPVLLEQRAPPAPVLVAQVAVPVLDVRHRATTGPPIHIRHHALLL